MDREQEYTPPPSMAAIMGEDLGPDPFMDAGPSLHPDDRSSAARMASHVERQRQEAAAARVKLAAEIREEIEAEKQNPYRGIPTAELMGRAYLRHGRGQDNEES